jgi:hypothetical protein
MDRRQDSGPGLFGKKWRNSLLDKVLWIGRVTDDILQTIEMETMYAARTNDDVGCTDGDLNGRDGIECYGRRM